MNNKKLTLGSLFDGSGGFPLGGLISGITPVWASEIEPFPIRVTTKRLPFVKHYGDISRMDGGKIEPVDVITFGSPCQDMSVAGKRDGLDGERSSLFYEAIRIIKEMRCATNGKYPRYIVWENVPGAFSSNGGKDFKAVLETVIGIIEPNTEVPMPEKARWPYADCYMGNGWSIAYRVLDAQYWGVPQRRKRIYLVADFAGRSAFDILFKSEGLSGYSAESFRSWQRTAGNIETCPGASSLCLNDQGGQRMDVTQDITATLRAEAHHPPCVMESAGFCTEHSAKSRGIGYEEECSPTLRAGVVPAAVYENHSQDTRYTGPLDVAPTVMSTYGTGGNNQPFVVSENRQTVAYGICSKESNSMLSDNPHSGFYKAETSRTLDANGGNPSCNQGGIAVIEGNGTRPSHKGDGYKVSEVMYTLNATEQHGVAYGIDRSAFNQGANAKFGFSIDKEVEPPIVARGVGAVAHPTFCSSKNSHHTIAEEELANTLVASDYKDPPVINSTSPEYTVRRLTPTECARLQGFPDWWCSNLGTDNPTDDELCFWRKVFKTYAEVTGCKMKSDKQIAKWLKNPHSDSAEYKMWGNGVALPCVVFVLSGISYFARNETENSP